MMIVTGLTATPSEDRRDPQGTTYKNDFLLCGHSYDRLDRELASVEREFGKEMTYEYWKVAEIISDGRSASDLPNPH